MSQLRIADGLTLPIEAVTEKLAFLGRTGGGKTYAAMKLAEEMHRAGAQFIVLDPVGKWWGLRLAADGKAPGIPIPVFGGLHGDVPLESTAGKLVADLIADRSISVVLDVSQFESDAAKARFASDFADRFFFRKKSHPSAVHLFLEEAQEFVPQNPQREEGIMLHRFTRYIKLGRNFGLGCSLISQRPQEVNKKCLNQTELLFAFQMTGPQERKTVEGWIAEKGIDEDIAGELPKLQRGSPHVWSPAWLQISKVVTIREKQTFDASSTPKVGARAVESQPLAPVDLEWLQKEMAATVEKAKQEDPKLLRQEIATLRAQVLKLQKGAYVSVPTVEVQTKVEEIKVPVLSPQDLHRFEEAISGAMDAQTAAREAASSLNQAVAGVGQLLDNARQVAARAALTPRSIPRPVPTRPAPVRTRATTRETLVRGERNEIPLGKSHRAVLAVLAQHAEGCDRRKLTLLAGYRWSGGFRNTLGDLRTLGYIEGGNDAVMQITEAGLDAIQGDWEPLPQGEELVEYWLRHPSLGKAERAVLEVLTSAPGRHFTADQLTERTGYAWSGGFRNALGALRTAGLLVGSNTGQMQANEELFS